MKEEIFNELMARYRMLDIMRQAATELSGGEDKFNGLDLRLLTISFRKEEKTDPDSRIIVRYVDNEAGKRVEIYNGGQKYVQSISEANTIEMVLEQLAFVIEYTTEKMAEEEGMIIEWDWLGD